MYWRMGSLVNEHSEWGGRFVESLSADVRREFPGIKGFSARHLNYMAKLAREADAGIVQTVFAQLSWSHSIALMGRVPDAAERLWYAREALANENVTFSIEHW